LCRTQADDEYMISDNDLPTNRFVSVPKSYGSFNPGALVAGMIRGMLDAAGLAARWGRQGLPSPPTSKPHSHR
jgi:hypothetical protein